MLVGGSVVLFTGFIFPVFGHLSGGFVAGYLRGSDRRESTLTGVLTGALATAPGLLIVWGFVFFLFSPLGDTGGMLVLFGLFAFFYAGLIALAGLFGALGGYVGSVVTDRRPPQES